MINIVITVIVYSDDIYCVFYNAYAVFIMQGPSKDNFDTISALDIAEQLTYLDHHIFKAIRSE